jgi:hypothetical protein
MQGNGVTEIIAASTYVTPDAKSLCQSFAKDLSIELRELSKLPSFSIGNLYHNIFCRTQARQSGGLKVSTPIYQSVTQDDPLSPRSIRLQVLKNGGNTAADLSGQMEDAFQVQSPSGVLGISSNPEFLQSTWERPHEWRLLSD